MATIVIEGADDLRSRLLELDQRFAGSLRPALDPIGASLLEAQRGALAAGQGWPALSEATLALRKRQGRGGAPLRSSGRLYDSLAILRVEEAAVDVGSALVQAGLLEGGGVTSKASMIPGAVIPARPFIGIPPALADSLCTSLLDFLMGQEVASA